MLSNSDADSAAHIKCQLSLSGSDNGCVTLSSASTVATEKNRVNLISFLLPLNSCRLFSFLCSIFVAFCNAVLPTNLKVTEQLISTNHARFRDSNVSVYRKGKSENNLANDTANVPVLLQHVV